MNVTEEARAEAMRLIPTWMERQVDYEGKPFSEERYAQQLNYFGRYADRLGESPEAAQSFLDALAKGEEWPLVVGWVKGMVRNDKAHSGFNDAALLFEDDDRLKNRINERDDRTDEEKVADETAQAIAEGSIGYEYGADLNMVVGQFMTPEAKARKVVERYRDSVFVHGANLDYAPEVYNVSLLFTAIETALRSTPEYVEPVIVNVLDYINKHGDWKRCRLEDCEAYVLPLNVNGAYDGRKVYCRPEHNPKAKENAA